MGFFYFRIKRLDFTCSGVAAHDGKIIMSDDGLYFFFLDLFLEREGLGVAREVLFKMNRIIFWSEVSRVTAVTKDSFILR